MLSASSFRRSSSITWARTSSEPALANLTAKSQAAPDDGPKSVATKTRCSGAEVVSSRTVMTGTLARRTKRPATPPRNTLSKRLAPCAPMTTSSKRSCMARSSSTGLPHRSSLVASGLERCESMPRRRSTSWWRLSSARRLNSGLKLSSCDLKRALSDSKRC